MTKKYTCLIVDDEPLAIELIKTHVSKISSLSVVGSTHSPIDALKMINAGGVDLIFLDIQMPVLTGLELARSLKNPPSIIFTTAYRDYAAESYELDVVDYLVKPITFARFIKAINRFFDKSENKKVTQSTDIQLDEEGRDYLFVNVSRKFQRINFQEIEYIESLREYVRIYLKDKSFMTKSSMGEIEKQLPNYFLRIHRSFIVNTNKVDAYTSHDVEIGDKEIPIGVSYKKEVQQRFLKL